MHPTIEPFDHTETVSFSTSYALSAESKQLRIETLAG